MTKRDVFQLLRMIASYYESFVVNQEKVDTWYRLLHQFSFEAVEENLLAYVTESPYPPKLSDLVKKPHAASRVVPSCDETKVILWQRNRPASPEAVQEYLAKIRVILGIVRPNDPLSVIEERVDHAI